MPWPNDHVYRCNGQKAPFHPLTIPEFVMGYCKIAIACLPVIDETLAAIDHIDYLSNVMGDIYTVANGSMC